MRKLREVGLINGRLHLYRYLLVERLLLLLLGRIKFQSSWRFDVSNL